MSGKARSASRRPDAFPPRDGRHERFEYLATRAAAEINAGDLRLAAARFDEALSLAEGIGDQTLIDRTICNRSAVLLELGEATSMKSELQAILMRSDDAEVRFLAAYSLSRAYEIGGDPERALFYARIANRHAATLETTDRLASSHSRIAVLEITTCHFSEAESQLLTALDLLPETPTMRHVFALDNLGYCYVMQGRFRKGFRALFHGLRLCRRLGGRFYELNLLISLAVAYLQVERSQRALDYARRSLHLAEDLGDRLAVKNALFILGEAHKQLGNPLGARRCFERLQSEYYPDMVGVSDLLLVLNVQSFINIKG